MKKKILSCFVALIIVITSVIPMACQSHEHNYNRKIPSGYYLVSEATCTKKARYNYSCKCGQRGEKIFEYGDALNHDFSEPTYAWHNSVCVAKRICFIDSEHIQSEVVEGVYVKDTEGSLISAEKGHYVASFNNPAFSSQQTPKNSVTVGDTTNNNESNKEIEKIEKAIYSFGIMSDIHLQDTDFLADKKYSLTDYQRALNFYKSNDVDLVAIVGDIVANNRSTAKETDAPIEWVNELKLFSQYNKTYFPEKPVYACVGNHDATPYGRYEGEYIADIRQEKKGYGLSQTVSVYEDGTKTAEQIWEEIIGNPINFVVEHKGDVFIFFSMYYWYYSKFCRDSDVSWLETQLEKYKESRVFLFFHLPIMNAFDPSTQGALVTPNGFSSNYRFGQLVEKYDNVVYFSGHTHYNLNLESKDENFVNVYQKDNGMVQVHCASGSYTRLPVYDESGKYDTYSNESNGSQGYLVDVYKNKIVIKGIDFSLGTSGAFLPYVSYIINL